MIGLIKAVFKHALTVEFQNLESVTLVVSVLWQVTFLTMSE